MSNVQNFNGQSVNIQCQFPMLEMFSMSGLHLAHSGLADFADFVAAVWWWKLKADADLVLWHGGS